MTQSPEYPDLQWVPPRAWGAGRDGKAVRYIVVHYTAGSERSTSAEDGAEYDRTRTDGTSTHYFVDSNSVVQCVRTRDRANAARHKGNRLGIQYELCGTAQTRAQWLDAASYATLQNAARQMARDSRKYDIPVRRLSVAQTRRLWSDFPSYDEEGFVGHVDCTNAYPEDGGDHTDPGTGFPWDVLLGMVQAELEDDMTPEQMTAWAKSPEGKKALYDGVNQDTVQRYDANGKAIPADPNKPHDETMTWASALAYLGKDTAQLKKWLVEGIGAILTATSADDLDEELLATLMATKVLAGLPPSQDQPVSAELLKTSIVAALRELAATPNQ